ncbi:MFS family permease [Constrictibacter sp. MBR-5]|jgi:MFS family permease|uniref:MFS transporter n=1 Tax=Constrictibacter sp. MBR-5 TaxID=3156467 RepID=UPI003395229D
MAGDVGWGAVLRGANGLRALVLAGGVALHAVYVFVASTVMPSVVVEVGGVAYYAWATTVFVVGSIVGSAVATALAARLGPRGAYRAGAALFIAGSLACALTTSMPTFLAGRTLQGLGGGMLVALAYATIRQLFAPEVRPRAFALISGVWGVAALCGPLLGGAFDSAGLWRGAFWVAVPLTAAFAVMVQSIVPRRSEGQERRGVAGLRLFLLALAAFAVSAGSVPGELWAAATGLCVAVLLMAALFAVDRHATGRLLPTGVYDPRNRLGAISLTMTLMIVGTGAMSFLPYVLRAAHGHTPLVAGYAAALQAMGWSSSALVTASASGGAVRLLLRVGPAVMATGLLAVAVALQSPMLLPTAVSFFVVGTGIGLCWAHLGNLLIGAARDGEHDLTASFISTGQLIALAFGAALAGMVANTAGLPLARASGEITTAAAWLYGSFAVAPALAFFAAQRALALLPHR